MEHQNENKKEVRRQKDRRDTLIVVCVAAVFVVLLAALLIVLLGRGETPDRPNSESTTETPAVADTPAYTFDGFTPIAGAWTGALDGNLSVELVGSYSGPYVEDGSDTPIDGVLAMIVKNNGSDWIPHAKIALHYGDETAWFRVNALPADSAAIVLESNALKYAPSMEFTAANASAAQSMIEPISDFSSDFALHCADGLINIENISGEDFSNKVQVFYKNYDMDSGLYVGGIAYSVSADGIVSGEIIQCLAEHYSETSVILYMTYDE